MLAKDARFFGLLNGSNRVRMGDPKVVVSCDPIFMGCRHGQNSGIVIG
jgi:hypothetical protein